MFIFHGISAVGRMGKAICGCLCCLIIGGPILIVVGIILLAAKNTRADDVSTYNKAVGAYQPTITNAWLPASVNASYSTVSLTSRTESVPVVGNTDGVDRASSTFLAGTVPNSVSGTISIGLANSPAFEQYVTSSKSKSTSIKCTYRGDCTYSQMRSICENSYSGGYYTGSSCSYNSYCGSCSYNAYLSEVCVVVAGSVAPFRRDPGYSSCFYPFKSEDQKYVTTQYNSYTVSARQTTDPFIVLQRISEGTMDFGITAAQQRGVALACLGIGAFFILASCAVGYCLYSMVKKVAGHNNGHDQAMMQQGQNYAVPPPMAPAYQQGPPPQPYYQGPPPQPQYQQGPPPQPYYQGPPPPQQGYPQQGYPVQQGYYQQAPPPAPYQEVHKPGY